MRRVRAGSAGPRPTAGRRPTAGQEGDRRRPDVQQRCGRRRWRGRLGAGVVACLTRAERGSCSPSTGRARGRRDGDGGLVRTALPQQVGAGAAELGENGCDLVHGRPATGLGTQHAGQQRGELTGGARCGDGPLRHSVQQGDRIAVGAERWAAFQRRIQRRSQGEDI